jgi:hypothetical protein
LVPLEAGRCPAKLNRPVHSDSPEFQWIRDRLKRGRAALAKILEEAPDLKEVRDVILPTLERSEVLADLEKILRPLRKPD